MFTIYTQDRCSFCTRAKIALGSRGLKYEERNRAEHDEEMQARVLAATGEPARTVPQIFEGDRYVGGFDQLKKELESGR